MSDQVSPQDLYDYLREKDVPHVHAMGMLASIEGESNFHAGIQERHPTAGRGGYGLFQHTGPRRRALEAYARATKRDLWDWRMQVDFALTESDTDHYLSREFASANEALIWFVRHWERPANPDRDIHKRSVYLAQLEGAIHPSEGIA